MTESIITISIVGLFAGFIFSMPIAGPISILITSNALKGRRRYCNLVNIGASFGTFAYVFCSVYGLTKLYHLYKPLFPYLFFLGSIFLLFLGYRIFKTKIDIDHFEDKGSQFDEKLLKKHRGGFYTGFIINFLNPTLFIGWLTSTFLVMSFIGSLGFNSGGLDVIVNEGVKEIGTFDGTITGNSKALSVNDFPTYFHLLISLFYALFIAAGSIIWFYTLALLITRCRKYLNIKVISIFIKGMGILLCLIGLYFGYLALKY